MKLTKPIYVFAAFTYFTTYASTFANSETYNASSMWGTAPVTSNAESSVAHVNNGVVAGQVNAAEAGQLVTTGSAGNIYAIGSQTIVSSTINGNDNDVSIEAEQNSTNSGDVENTGQLIREQNVNN